MTTAQKIAVADRLRAAVIDAIDENRNLVEVATFLRLAQLMGQGAHPDDCISWKNSGADPAMGRLGDALEATAYEKQVDNLARGYLSLIRLGQTTLDVIDSGEDEWGGAIATAQQFRGQS